MSETRWTPGPWEIRMPHGYAAEIVCQNPVGEGVIADFGPCDNSDSQIMANASLIAAAPDMAEGHEANAGDLWLLRKAIESGDPLPELLLRIDDMLRRTKTLSAKARGETP